MPTSSKAVGLKHGFRSGLEETVSAQLIRAGFAEQAAQYEAVKVPYVTPATPHKYTPDFPLGPFFVETKGRFLAADRKKHLLIKAQHPELDIRFVFSRSATPITKGSKTTYADWCRKNGFQFSDKTIPASWLDELKQQ